MRRDRKAMNFTGDDFKRPPPHTAGKRKLINFMINLLMRHQKEKRIMATGNQNRARLTFGKIFFTDQTALLTWRHPDSNSLLVMNHDAVCCRIYPACIGITHNDRVIRTDITTTIKFMDKGCREFPDIDLVISHDVFHHRASRHLDRRNKLELAL